MMVVELNMNAKNIGREQCIFNHCAGKNYRVFKWWSATSKTSDYVRMVYKKFVSLRFRWVFEDSRGSFC